MTSTRRWIVGGLCLSLALIAVAVSSVWLNAADGPGSTYSSLTEAQLGEILESMGLKVDKVEQRFDFSFKARHNADEWDLSMTAVLSKDGKSVWVMAWLDELPRSAAAVPRSALLRLLADNDRLGHGKFFAYISTNRRFVMERVVPNRGLNTAILRSVLKDLGRSVVEAYPHWSTDNWVPATQQVQAPAPGKTVPANATRSAVNDSKFNPEDRN
ncbi:MAG: hypothetical protein CMJ78_06775 [Planctomycetaceae bacterium]|nr:hypothetical protein [Planctomycetaceae bacterium]